MTGIGGGELLAGKNVAKVSTAIGTLNLGTEVRHADNFGNGTLDFLIKTGPTAAGMEFGGGQVEGSMTAPAVIGTLNEILVILAGKGWLGALVNNYLFLLRSERVEFGCGS